MIVSNNKLIETSEVSSYVKYSLIFSEHTPDLAYSATPLSNTLDSVGLSLEAYIMSIHSKGLSAK